ncbi:hypothetical protein [Blastococcus brunescens]|uniref:Sucrase ferredoxin n=1 Tax=Blastococcus brunescens TaxID=1564165 RepID=A0ABZ1B5I3_9ACTN|nr:hypothetical protein [Blastococcus sp. BMG 8361]WRL66072.1 hypothetical protein U6N30_11350 [Blastococcus sp. BMG 8361]
MTADDLAPGRSAASDDFCRTDTPARPAGRLDDTRCSVRALTRGDSPMATASPAQRWLLIEQPGPWGRDALTGSRFDAEVAPLLAGRSRAEGCACCWCAAPVTGSPTRDAGGPMPTAAQGARASGGRCGRPTPTC